MTGNDEEAREQKREQQTNEIYAAIGKYVIAFELLVHAVRTACILLTTANNKHQQLMNIIFHHKLMSAWPIFDVYQSLVGHLVFEHDTNDGANSEETKIIRDVLKQINIDYQAICDKRNDHLHATWLVGWGNETTTDFSKIGFIKGKPTRDGLKFMPGPENAEGVTALAKECDDLTDFFWRFHGALTWHTGPRVAKNFIKEGKRWSANRPKKNT